MYNYYGIRLLYKNNQKDLHYYRCLKCNGVSVNAFTTARSKRKGANELFLDFLKKFVVPDAIIPLVKLQLTKIFYHHNEGNSKSDNAVKSQLEGLEKKLKDLKIRHGLGEIDKKTYDLTFTHLNDQIRSATKEVNTLMPKIFNLEKLLSSSLKKLKNLSAI